MRSFVRFSTLQINDIVTNTQRISEKLFIFISHIIYYHIFLLLSLLLL